MSVNSQASFKESSPKSPTGRPESAGRLRLLFFISLAVLVLLNLFILPHHPHFGLEKIPGFWALFGLAGAVILARVAKGAAHTFLGKDEDYYEKKD